MKRTHLVILLGTIAILGCNNITETERSSVLTDEKEQNIRKEAPNQKILVVESNAISNQDAYILYGKELVNTIWTTTFDTIACNVGRNGVAPFGEKIEGDGRTPSGLFDLGFVFGYPDSLNFNREYVLLTESHHWNCDSSSEDYNSLVLYKPTDKNSEKMLRKDDLYSLGIVIEYNTKPAMPKKGSAIFIHVQRDFGKPTAGCISIPKEALFKVIKWLDSDENAKVDISE